MRKRTIAITLLVLAVAVYIAMPIKIHSRNMEITTLLGSKIVEQFSVPPLKFSLKIEISAEFVGVLNITILESATNKAVFSWQESAISKSTRSTSTIISVASSATYLLIITTTLGTYNISYSITAYTIPY